MRFFSDPWPGAAEFSRSLAYFAAQSSNQTRKDVRRKVGQLRLWYVAKRYSVENCNGLAAVRRYRCGSALSIAKLSVRHLTQIQNDVLGQLLLAHLRGRAAEIAGPFRDLSFLQYVLRKLVSLRHQTLLFLFFGLVYRGQSKFVANVQIRNVEFAMAGWALAPCPPGTFLFFYLFS